jgi:hypothetical protein
LRDGIWAVEQEDSDLLVRLLADIHSPMNAGTRLLPLDLSRRDLDALALTSIPVFNREEIASHHYRHPLKGIAMPRHRLAGSKS